MSSPSVQAKTFQNELEDSEFTSQSSAIENQIFYLENVTVTVSDQVILYDIDNNPSYLLSIFEQGGYAISSRENHIIAIYDL